jgi:hypothetical protein
VIRLIGRFIVVVAAALGGITSSQLPEFAQQYRQRLGGALEELRQVVTAFEADAARSDLTREEALETYGRVGEPFLRDQGVTTRSTIERYEDLAEQRARFELASPMMRPVVMLTDPDERVVRGAWADYEPAVPVSTEGFVWAALGFFLAGGLISLLRQIGGIIRRRQQRLAPAGQ